MEIPIETTLPIVEPKSSVKVTKNSRGYSWDVKVYDQDVDKAFNNELKDILWGENFWSSSYCLITTGQVTLDQLKKYVENQRGKTK